jgi:hypothetical protein
VIDGIELRGHIAAPDRFLLLTYLRLDGVHRVWPGDKRR